MVDFLEELVNDYNKKLHKLSENEAKEIKNEILSIAKDMGVDISRLFAGFDKKSATPQKNDAQKSPTKRVPRAKRPASPKKEKTAPEPKKVEKKASEGKERSTNIKPIRKLGTGSNVYFESKKYRVNEDTYGNGQYVLNITEYNQTIPSHNIKFKNLKDAIKVAKELEYEYPFGVRSNFNYEDFYNTYILKIRKPSPEPKKVEKKASEEKERKIDVSGIITFSEYEKASKGYGSDKLPKEFKILEYSVMMADRLCQDNKNVLSCNLAFGGLNNPNGPFREGITYAYSKKNRNLSLFRTLKSGALKILNIVKDGGLPVDNFIEMVQSAEYQEPKKIVKKSAPKGKVVDWDIQKRIASEKSSNETVDKFKEILKFQEEQKRKEEEEKNKSRKDELESRKRNAVWLKKDGGYVKIPSGVKGLEYYWSKKYKTFIYVSTNELQSGTEYLKRISDLDAVVEKADEILGEADWSKFYNDLSENKLEPYKRVTMKFKAEVDKIFNSPRQRKTNKKSAPKGKVIVKKDKVIDCGDNCLAKGIEYVRDNIPVGEGLVKMAFERDMLDKKRYNEFGKALLTAKNPQDVSVIIQQFSKKIEEKTPFQKRQERPNYMKIFEGALDTRLGMESDFFGSIKYISNIDLNKDNQVLKLDMVAIRTEDIIKRSGINPEIDLIDALANNSKGKLYFYDQNNPYSVEVTQVDLIKKTNIENSAFAKYYFEIRIILRKEDDPQYLKTKKRSEDEYKKFIKEVNSDSNWGILNSKVRGLTYYWNKQKKEMVIRHNLTGALLSTPTNSSKLGMKKIVEFADNILNGYDWTKIKHFPRKNEYEDGRSVLWKFTNAINSGKMEGLSNKPKRNYKKASGLSNKVVNHLKGAKQVATSKKLTFSQKLRKLLEY